MLLFNYQAIYLLARGDSTLIIKYLQSMQYGRYSNLRGLNFLKNPSILFRKDISDKHKAEFVGICSLRRLSDYKTKNNVNLHISKVPPWVKKSVVEENPLIEIKQPLLILKSEGK